MRVNTCTSNCTVSTHKNNAMRKLGLTTDADLIKYAYATGMI